MTPTSPLGWKTESADPQDDEPTVGKEGRAYVSLLNGNLMIHVRDKSIFDLTEQDGRDLAEALLDTLARDAARKAA